MIHSCQHEDDRKRAAEKGQGGSQRTVVMPTPFLHRGLIGRRLSGQKYTQSMDFSTHRETETIHSSNSNRGKGDDLLGLWDVINTSRGMFKNVFAIQDSSPCEMSMSRQKTLNSQVISGILNLVFHCPGFLPRNALLCRSQESQRTSVVFGTGVNQLHPQGDVCLQL